MWVVENGIVAREDCTCCKRYLNYILYLNWILCLNCLLIIHCAVSNCFCRISQSCMCLYFVCYGKVLFLIPFAHGCNSPGLLSLFDGGCWKYGIAYVMVKLYNVSIIILSTFRNGS